MKALALLKSESISLGLAMFAMFFGAGNIIYPLVIGQHAGDKNLFAISGLVLTAAVMPMLGLIAMILFDGDYRRFFGRLGSIPGFLLALLTISLLGPLGSTPRCIALAYTTLRTTFLDVSPTLFSAIACCIIFLFTVKQKYVLSLLAWVLTPLLLGSLIIIIFLGLISGSETQAVQATNLDMFLHGIREGYNTMDLLAAFFFSSTIIKTLKMRHQETGQNYVRTAFQASLIGATLLAAIYIGFSYIAAFHGTQLSMYTSDELLSAITIKLAGPYAGMLVCIAISLACLTTAIALISAFTDFVQKEVFDNKISYAVTLIGALSVTFFVSTFEFTGIAAFLWPVLQICYPGLIVLTFLNIIHKTMGFKPLKVPVALAFSGAIIAYFIS
ncbi:MAG: branched-chain amino acid transport system II carrier protein [Candidatus Protochlamydia sp.]|nr:branched-chain amino acid transport system II carrier protein [Candidatus Protochlamydia sp.]